MNEQIRAEAQDRVHRALADGRILGSRVEFWTAQLTQQNELQRERAAEVLDGLENGLPVGDWFD
ncbi:hypothetical protein ACFWB0_02855 [Rhodococcus sp. NPDC060086]|uniref:hypothetical protein n=1 Tax=Rhodococcus sp. NPDC060086 TaxID=3347055 RepID=UPI00365AD460